VLEIFNILWNGEYVMSSLQASDVEARIRLRIEDGKERTRFFEELSSQNAFGVILLFFMLLFAILTAGA